MTIYIETLLQLSVMDLSKRIQIFFFFFSLTGSWQSFVALRYKHKALNSHVSVAESSSVEKFFTL